MGKGARARATALVGPKTARARARATAKMPSAMFVTAMFFGPGAGGDADVRMCVEQVHKPIAPGSRLRDQEE